MTKLFLKYELNLPNDEYDHLNLVNANKYRRLLNELFQQFRRSSKDNEDGGSWQEAYDLIWRVANEEGLDPWEDIF